MDKKQKGSRTSAATNKKGDQRATGPLPGQPGYRTRAGRTGLDPIDNRTEAAYTAGSFIQRLFTGRLSIENLPVLVVLGVFGAMLLLPLVIAVLEWVNRGTLPPEAWILFLIAGVLGIFLLINFFINLARFVQRIK